ncbi:MAG: alpha/beta fold hydrolase [Gammaproteobacteria bacterium]
MNKFAKPTKHTVTLPDPAGTHQMVYYEWGNPENPRVLVCLHGLTRNGRDFDFLAAALLNEYRILAPDLIGRGKSEWMKDPALYTIEQYVADLVGWMHQLGLKKVDFLGASLGGILGMLITVQPNSPIQRLLLDDIGPIIKKESANRLSEEVESNPTFKSLGELKDFLKHVYATTGTMEPYHWDHLLAHDHISLPDGTYARAYDPQLFMSFLPMLHGDIAFWPVFKAIHIPIFVLHGEQSVVLTPDICAEMKQYQPTITIVDLPGITHCPSLMDERIIGIVKHWAEQFAHVKQISG